MHGEYDLTTERWFSRWLFEYMRADRSDQLAIGRALLIDLREQLVLAQEHFPAERQIRALGLEPVDAIDVDGEHSQSHVLDPMLGGERAIHDRVEPERGLWVADGTQA